MSDVALEIRTKDESGYPLCNMIGAGGPSPNNVNVFEVLLAVGQWTPVKAHFDQLRLPYKFAQPSNAMFMSENNPNW